MSRLIQAVLYASLFAGNIAGAQTADTVNGPKPLFKLGDLVTAGAFTLATIALAPADHHVTHQLQSPARQSNKLLNRSAGIFRVLGSPGGLITGTGLYLLGTADGQRRTQDLGLHTVESILLADGITFGLKIVTGRARPRMADDASSFQLLRGLRNEEYRSFPSGHATSAFAFAAAVSSETQRWWP
ncbi:MAG: phosphatase PAP2 family protein, partial [Gemmatimonadaceae bacterium]